jgi:hypothetical protein
VQTEARTGTTWRWHRPGQQVDITYDPRGPRHAYAGSGASSTLIALSFVVMGGLTVLFGRSW